MFSKIGIPRAISHNMTNLATLRLDVNKNQNPHTSTVIFINGIAAEIKAACEVPVGTSRPVATVHTEYDRNNQVDNLGVNRGDTRGVNQGDNRGTGYDSTTLATDRSRSSVGINEVPASGQVAYREGYIDSSRVLALAAWLIANADGLAYDITNKAGAPRP